MEAVQSMLQNSGVVMAVAFLWGLACKRFPFLEKIPNNTIPYVNTALLFLRTLVPAPADASPVQMAVFHMPAIVTVFGNLVLSAFQSAALSLVYDKLVKPLEKTRA